MPRRIAQHLVAAASLLAFAAVSGGCMGTPTELVLVEPTYVLEHVADADAKTQASWPVIAEGDALVNAAERRRGYVAELAYLPQ